MSSNYQQSSGKFNRRHFILATSLLMCGMNEVAHSQTAKQNRKDKYHPLRFGAPLFTKESDPEKLAQLYREEGYSAAYCPNVSINNKDAIAAYKKGFQKFNVIISEVGRWYNLLDSDSEKRKKNIQIVTEGLALADEIGALCCVDIAGSFNPKRWDGPHPDNFSKTFFDAAVENARKIIDGVKPVKAKFCYEMMGWSIPESPDRYLKLLKAVDRKGFGVHLDPCNLVNSPEKFYRNADLINECFDKLGKWIVSCHGKDLFWEAEMNVHFREVIPGTGSMDYRTYLKRLAKMNPPPPLMLEHLSSAQEYNQARQFVINTAKNLGLEFA